MLTWVFSCSNLASFNPGARTFLRPFSPYSTSRPHEANYLVSKSRSAHLEQMHRYPLCCCPLDNVSLKLKSANGLIEYLLSHNCCLTCPHIQMFTDSQNLYSDIGVKHVDFSSCVVSSSLMYFYLAEG